MKYLSLTLILSLILLANCTHNLYTQAPKFKGRINDYYGILSEIEKRDLDKISYDLEKQIGSQLVILIIDSTNEESIEEYSLRVANSWGIGRKEYNDGVVITIAIKDKKVRIEVGYGLENILTDNIAKDIIDRKMIPLFKINNYYLGLHQGMEEIVKNIITNRNTIKPNFKNGG
jgi:uncharacterized membrane protein YgcG